MTGVRDRHEKAGAALAGESRRHDFVQLSGGKLDGLGHPKRGLERQRRVELRNALTEFDDRFRSARPLFDLGTDFDDPGARVLAANADVASSQGQQDRMGCDGGVSYKRQFLPRIEEAQPDIVVRTGGGEHEGDFGVRELACDRAQGGLILPVGVERNDGRIAREAGRGKGIYLKNAQSRLLRP